MRLQKFLNTLFLSILVFSFAFESKGENVLGDSSEVIVSDSLSSFIKKDFELISAQLKKNEENSLKDSSSDNLYVFHAQNVLQVEGQDKFFYITNVNKSQYGINSSGDEASVNNLLSEHAKNNVGRRIIVYVTTILSHPYTGMRKDVNRWIAGAKNEINKEVDKNITFNMNGYTIVCVLKFTTWMIDADKEFANNKSAPPLKLRNILWQTNYIFLSGNSGLSEQCKNSLFYYAKRTPTNIIGAYVSRLIDVVKGNGDCMAIPNELAQSSDPCDIKINEGQRKETIKAGSLMTFIAQEEKTNYARSSLNDRGGIFAKFQDYAKRITDAQLRTCFVAEDRIKIIKYLKNVCHAFNDQILDDDEQKFLVRLIKTFPDNIPKKKDFLTQLKLNGIIDFLFDATLAQANLDGDELIEFSTCLEKDFIQKVYPEVKSGAVSNIQTGKVFTFSPPLFTEKKILSFDRVEVIDIDEKNQIHFGSRIQFTWIINTNSYDPYASYSIKFIDEDFQVGTQIFKKDEIYTGSALLSFVFLRLAMEQKLMKQGEVIVTTAFVAYGLATMSVTAAEYLVVKEATEKFARGAAIDYTMQVAINHYFGDVSLPDAYTKDIDYVSLGTSGILEIIENKKLDMMWACADALNKSKIAKGNYSFESFADGGMSCFNNAMIVLLADKVIENSAAYAAKLTVHLKNNPVKFISACKNKLNMSDQQIDNLLTWLKFDKSSIVDASKKFALNTGKALSASAKYISDKASSITNVVTGNTWQFFTSKNSNKVFAEINKDGELAVKAFSDIPLKGDEKIIKDASFIDPNGNKVTDDIAFVENTATGECGIVGQACFVKGTLIFTSKGLKTIEDIKVSDSVWSYNFINKKSELKPVLRTFKKTSYKLVKIIAGEDTIITTSEHPFYVENIWVRAASLTKGKSLTRFENESFISANIGKPDLARSSIEIDEVQFIDSSATVYNFEVEDFHNYYVGYERVLVHNKCSNICELVNGLVDASKYIQEGKYIEGVKKIDLMGGKVSQIGGGFINIDMQATKGINGDVSKLSQYIPSNSIDEIIVSNPFPNAPFAGPKDFFLIEASKVMKPGATMTINGTFNNKFFKNIKSGNIEDIGFEIIEFQEPLKEQFQKMKFYQVDGITEVPIERMLTTIIRKK